MLVSILVQVPLILFPLLNVPPPTRDCQFEILRPEVIEGRALSQFDTNVQAYAEMHRRLARWMPANHMAVDEGGFFNESLRESLVAANPQAREGGFFTPGVAQAFRARIDRALSDMPFLDVTGYRPLPGEQRPIVNPPFSMVLREVSWPSLIDELPRLPHELGYVFWGRDLVLVDLMAHLVVDVLPEALPEDTFGE